MSSLEVLVPSFSISLYFFCCDLMSQSRRFLGTNLQCSKPTPEQNSEFLDKQLRRKTHVAIVVQDTLQ